MATILEDVKLIFKFEDGTRSSFSNIKSNITADEAFTTATSLDKLYLKNMSEIFKNEIFDVM